MVNCYETRRFPTNKMGVIYVESILFVTIINFQILRVWKMILFRAFSTFQFIYFVLNVTKKRLPPKKRTICELEEPSCSKSQTKIRKIRSISHLSKEYLKSLVNVQQTQIKSLKQKIRCKEKKIKSLNSYIYTLSEDKLVSPVVAEQLKETFSSLTSELIVNHFNN